MDIRYSANQKDVKRYTTDELRNEFLITDLYAPNEVHAVYSHVDRMVTMGCMPTTETVSIDKGIDCWKNFGTDYFLELREIGIFNIGGMCSRHSVGGGLRYAQGGGGFLRSPLQVSCRVRHFPDEFQGGWSGKQVPYRHGGFRPGQRSCGEPEFPSDLSPVSLFYEGTGRMFYFIR